MLVCDTGVVYAALDRTDRSHIECEALMTGSDVVLIPAPVIVEVDQLAESRDAPEAIDALLAAAADGSMLVANLDLEDYVRIRELSALYGDLPLGFVDASVIAIAERLEETTIATLDRRHFSVVKPAHCEAFTLVP